MSTTSKELEHGDKFPFDAPDSWWEETLESNAPPATNWAHRAARGVIANLQDRRGIKHGFENIEENIRIEIVATLAAIIQAAMEGKS